MLRSLRGLARPRLKVFVSYASERLSEAESIVLALREDENEVFFDRDALRGSEAYNRRIRESIAAADAFVFLASPESLRPDGYAFTELGFARERWPQPADAIVPVLVGDVRVEDLPPYLRAVSVVDWGNRPARVAAAIAAVAKRQRIWLRRALLLLAAAALGALGVWAGSGIVGRGLEVRRIVSAAEAARAAGDYPTAWARYGRALAVDPGNPSPRTAMEDLGMRWLEDERALEGPGATEQIEGEVLPALERAAASAEGARAADLLAHVGWGEYQKLLADREARGVQDFFRSALERDPDNPFAHAMWGYFWFERSGELVEDGTEHFAAALAAGRERPAVRHLQIAALTHSAHNTSSVFLSEALRVASEMRAGGEAVSADDRQRLFGAYCSLAAEEEGAGLRSTGDPAGALSTFRWLAESAEAPPPLCARFAMATLQEASGARREALDAYRELQAELDAPETPAWLYNREISALISAAIPRLER